MISVAAIVFTDEQGRVLCVRKHTSPRFQLPGGKPEPGETLVDTALRETREEVGLDVDPEDLSYLGQFSAPASNEPGCTVTSTVFLHPGTGLSPVPAAEIGYVFSGDDENTVFHVLAGRVDPYDALRGTD